MKGRKPIPTKLKLLRGNPGKKAIGTEPTPTKGVGECPRWLDDEARRQWFAVVPELERLGLLTVVDTCSLAAYCQAISRWRCAEEILAKEGVTAVGSTGNMVRHPAITIAREAMLLMNRFAAEFGLTPAARARLKSAPEKPKDEFEEFLGRGKVSA